MAASAESIAALAERLAAGIAAHRVPGAALAVLAGDEMLLAHQLSWMR